MSGHKPYPIAKAYQTHQVKVSDLHTLSVREYGNKSGMPVLVIHGGPGAGCSDQDTVFFDPTAYRVILVDQRGAGQSTPFGEMRENTLHKLIADFELIRSQLGVGQWLLFGGSWGSTLGLAYAEAHPEVCSGLILRGIWLARQKEIDHFFQQIEASFPERAKDFYEYLPASERDHALAAYHSRLMNPDPNIHLAAAKAFATYEFGSAYHDPIDLSPILSDHKLCLGLARTEAHYMTNHMFLQPNQLLNDLDKIRHLPTELIHGRYDAVCPYSGAYELASHWPEARLTTINGGGHSAHDPAIKEALLAATERFRTGSSVA